MKKLFFLSIIALLTLSACQRDNGHINYFPFQTEEDGRWGMMSPSGEILFSDEFDKMPTMAFCDRFMVRNNDGLWEIYTAEEKPKQIGGEYLYVGRFVNGIAPVTERNKYITLINTEGEVVKTLDKIGSKTIAKMEDFNLDNGLAEIVTDDDLHGVINTKGDVVVKPIYGSITVNDMFIFAVDKKEMEKEKEMRKVAVLDLNGNVITTIDKQKRNIKTIFASKEYIVAKTADGYGILDKNSNWVLKPHEKYGEIISVQNGYFIFEKDNYGLRDLKGEVILRNKYDRLWFTENKDRLIARRDDEYTLINLEGDQIGEDKYEALWYLDEDHFIAQLNSSNLIILDANGKEIGDPNVDICDINIKRYGDSYIESDYIDAGKLVSSIAITKDGVDGLTFSSNPSDVIKHKETAENYSHEQNYYRGDTYVSYDKDFGVEDADINITMRFNGNVVQAVTEKKMRSYYNYYWYDDVVVGYEYTRAKPVSYSVKIKNKGKLYGKLDMIYDKLCSLASSQGKIEKKTDNSIIVNTGGSNYMTVSKHDDFIMLENGNPNTFRYSLSDLDYYDVDIIEVDTVAVDSVVY